MKVTSEILDRMPPHDREAEMCVLGSLLILPEAIDDVPFLRPEDFYVAANHCIYRQMLALYLEGERLDPLLLRDRLKQSGDFEDVGGDAYLADITRAVPTAANAEAYARIVQGNARLREVQRTATQTLQGVYEDGADAESLATTAERAFGKIATTGRHTDVPCVAEAVDQALERVRKLRANGCGLGLTTGLFDFDQAMGGLHPGELVVLAARPRIGKTALATQISRHNAEHGRRVLFVSLEMSRPS